MFIGSRVRELRKAKGLTQQDLADMINVTKVSVCCYEKGTRTPNLDTFVDLINALDTTAAYLLGMDSVVVAENEEDYKVVLPKEDIQIINEIRKTDEAIGKAIGEENYSSKIFRFPNGFMSKSYRKRKDRAEELLKEMNYSYLDWNCLNNDSIRKYSKFQLVENLKKSAKDKDILIILMHDTKDVSNSSEALEDSIKYLKSKGYQFKNFYD